MRSTNQRYAMVPMYLVENEVSIKQGAYVELLTIFCKLQWRNSCYQTFYDPIFHFLVSFYFIYNIECDQTAEYGTIKSLILRFSPLYGV